MATVKAITGLRSGARALQRLLKDIADSPGRDDAPEAEHSDDFVSNARMIEASIRANLVDASGRHREGYLRALTYFFAMNADNFGAGDDPIAATAAAFAEFDQLKAEMHHG